MNLTSTVTKSPSPNSQSDSVVSAQPPSFIPFQVGPSLEHIPDDVLLEVVSHLPTIDDTLCSPLASFRHPEYAIPSTVLVRTPTLHALSKTSRLLRSRCLAIAWQRTEFWGINFWKRFVFDNPMGKATKNTLRVLKACPHLLPLIRTMSVILIEYQKAEIIPAFAACLATLPNLNTIRVIGSETRMQTVIKDAFRGKQFPSVRRISLPSSAHEIVRKCPNVEEVACVDEDGSKIVQSLVEGKCHQVRILKGISAPLTRLADLVPNLTHASVAKGVSPFRHLVGNILTSLHSRT
ncbi:hypothetical protein L210DRAFT_3552465 [Boletus edulis BED1]|uniref:Uncharacterized protein n=1 Tax=Boletus edulis BED1 TaxID=1328754 RepID=A0AAD4BML9_BOLED|nr:hypothetical protein L210DRAFT_3552465 [Boletus edulis BED1]